MRNGSSFTLRSILPTLAVVAFASGAASEVRTAAVASSELQRVDEVSPRLLLAEIERARERVYPSLVNISVVRERFSGGRAQRQPAAGSGVIVSPEGHVLTNFHVARHTTRVTCRLATGESFDARVLAHDPLTDLSVLQIDAGDRRDPLPYASLGDSEALEVGDFVLAMGNPLALASSMTLGIVSNPKRVFTDFADSEKHHLRLDEDEVTGIFTQWVQHDALVLPGNSGGPLVNLRGEVVGINALGGMGVGFAIPSELARRVLEAVLEHGEVPRGWLGIEALPVEKLERDSGVLVSWVAPGSTAEAAGLEAGDVLLKLDGEPVSARFFEQIPVVYQRLAALPIGEEVAVRIERNGRERSLSVEVAAMEPFAGEQAEVRELGVTFREITGPMALARRLETTEGLLVTGIRPGYPFEEARPRVGEDDVVTAVAGRPVGDLGSLREVLAGLDSERDIPVTLVRGQEEIITVVDLVRPDSLRRGGELPKAWLGVRTQVLTPPVAEAMGVPGRRGFRITQVLPGTEAAEAGLRLGDVIAAVEDVELEAYRSQDAQELRRLIEEFPIGGRVELVVLRDGAERRLPVRLEASPPTAADAARYRHEGLELTVREITFMDPIDEGWPKGVEGVMAHDVTSGGWAHLAGLRIGDLILAVQDRPVPDLESFAGVLEEVLAERPRVIRLFVHRGHRTHFVFIEPDWEDLLPIAKEAV